MDTPIWRAGAVVARLAGALGLWALALYLLARMTPDRPCIAYGEARLSVYSTGDAVIPVYERTCLERR